MPAGYCRVTCSNPHCEHITVVREVAATLEEPGDVDRDTCEECDEDLDWDTRDSTSLEELRWEDHPDA